MRKAIALTGLVLLLTLVVSYSQFLPGLHAQEELLTSEEVTRDFLSLAVPGPRNDYEDSYPSDFRYSMFDLEQIVSRKSFEQLGERGVEQLMLELWEKSPAMKWETKAPIVSESTEIVTVNAKRLANPDFPVVCIKEGKGWRVDLVETFAQWFKLDDQRKQERLVDITGIALSPSAYERDGGRTLCQRNLKKLALGFKQYIQDYDERYPPAKQWADAIKPYVDSPKMFHCPVTEQNHGYAMNWKISTRSEMEIDHSGSMILLYEAGTLKQNHCGEGKDIVFRHHDGVNLAFVDGHVKWYPRNDKGEWVQAHFTWRPNY